ncbi:MAG: ABC transporter permease [Coriobacteriales bacterium]|jgi:cell division transport system permease protein|nr:ABC transporter permease [Coriobacteriales bacterium]
MVSMRSLWYFVKEAFSNSRKNFSTTLGAIVTIFLSLLVIGVFMVFSLIVNELIKQVESEIAITIWISDAAATEGDPAAADRDALMVFVEDIPAVAEGGVSYVSKEQAMERYLEMPGMTSEIASAIDGNPLPASIEIKLSDPEQVQSVVDTILTFDRLTNVIADPESPSDSFRYGEEFVQQLISVANIIRNVCLALVLMLVFVALIFINNTIRLAILARRKEIAIMRLVGASNGFIRGPFLMEGALQALIGAGLAIGSIAVIVFLVLIPFMRENIAWVVADIPLASVTLIYLMLAGVGLIIGLFGSLWAMRRYLKV